MNIFIVILSLAVLSECNPYKVDILPQNSITSTTEKNINYDPYLIEEFIRNYFKQTSSSTTTSTPFEKVSQTHKNDNSFETEEEISELITQVLHSKDITSEPSSNQKASTPSYSSTSTPIIRPTSSPILVTNPTKPQHTHSNNKVGLLFPSDRLHGSTNHTPSNHYQYSQSLVPEQNKLTSLSQKKESPTFQNVPHDIHDPFNPLPFYDQQDWTSPVISENQSPYYTPPYISEEIPIHSLHPISNQRPLIPGVPREEPPIYLPQFYSNLGTNYGPVPFSSTNENAGNSYEPSLPFLNNPLQNYGIPGQVVSSSVRTYIPQDQFYPLKFLVPQASTVSLYAPLPYQLSHEDIISLIQNPHASLFPAASSPSFNPPIFPLQSYTNHPNIASVPSNNEKVSAQYSSPAVKTSAPFSYFREPRTSMKSNLIFEGL